MNKKALILILNSFQDLEEIYPYHRVRENDLEVDIMSNKKEKIFGVLVALMEYII
tara:strand:+ start:190 stop:354 length:165 start_codon:yes stop_codon:yes gene_type:complete